VPKSIVEVSYPPNSPFSLHILSLPYKVTVAEFVALLDVKLDTKNLPKLK
jgi:hypothetical protein